MGLPVSERLVLPGSCTNPALVAARFLLTPGKTYARTVKDFEPFEILKKIDENARSAAATLIDEGARNTFTLHVHLHQQPPGRLRAPDH